MELDLGGLLWNFLTRYLPCADLPGLWRQSLRERARSGFVASDDRVFSEPAGDEGSSGSKRLPEAVFGVHHAHIRVESGDPEEEREIDHSIVSIRDVTATWRCMI